MEREKTALGGGEAERLSLVAYRVSDLPLRLVPAAATREWMDASPERFAYRCLPLVVASQAGWFVVQDVAVRACWNGGERSEDLVVEQDPPAPPVALSHFGCGVLTWHIPFLFRTPPGYNLLVRGPANLPVDGAFPLDGVVETDWAVATFTMNWLLTRPGDWVVFPKGQPIAMIAPQARFEVERFDPVIRPIASAPELSRAHRAWSEDRRRFNRDLQEPGSAAHRAGWQRHYFQGASPGGFLAAQHQVKLDVRPFVEERGDE
ncbi:MAG TPA: DUF6065 family protein [Thermoanaerobaculia bacterium]|nr:DUF6065 family protein [Thermoanaerobaculia bacterium]